MLDELLAQLATGEFEDDGWVMVTHADLSEASLRVGVRIRTGVAEQPDEAWDIMCLTPRGHRVELGVTSDLFLADDHVLLWPHTQPVVQIYFRGPPTEPRTVVGALYERHRALVADWIPFGRFLNQQLALVELLAAPSGLFGNGPQPLMLAYAEVLQDFGYMTSQFGPRPPTRIDTGLHLGEGDLVPETDRLAALILGENYVVAPAFLAERIPSRPVGESATQ
jgi:hypothetical protein